MPPAENPYQSPLDTTAEELAAGALASAVSDPDDDDDPIALKINIPAFALSATTWMRLVFEGPVLVFSAAMSAAAVYSGLYFDTEPLKPLLLFVASAAAVIVDLLILQGASAIFLQIPFGIWVLRVLSDREIQRRFER